MATLEQQFRSRVSAFLRRTSLRPTTFGLKALGDPNLLRQIDRGRSPSLRTADRVLEFMTAYDQRPVRGPGSAPARAGARVVVTGTKRTRRRSREMIEQPMEHGTSPPTRFLRLPEVQGRTGLSRSTIYVRLGRGSLSSAGLAGLERAVGWVEAEIDEWIRERIEESRGEGRLGGRMLRSEEGEEE